MTLDDDRRPAQSEWLPAPIVVTVAAVGVVLVGVVRLAMFGWGNVASDDARYLFVGLNLLEGRGPVTAEGTLFLLRAPVYSAILAIAARLVGGDPLVGAHLVASSVFLGGLAAGVVLAWRLAGALAAVGTAIAFVGTSLVWFFLPTLRIDLVQAAGIVAVLLAFGDGRGSVARIALAGVVLGLTILVKESALPLFVLPLAAFARDDVRGWFRRALAFAAAGAVTISWWWIFVWLERRVLFPLEGIRSIETRGVDRAQFVNAHTIALVGVMALAWAVVAFRSRRDPAVRPVLLAGLLVAAPAAYALSRDLSSRNYLGLAVLSTVAVGVAVAELARWAPRVGALRRVAPAAAILVLVVVAVTGQRTVARPNPPELPGLVAAWLRDNDASGDRAVMTFQYRSQVALQLYHEMPVVEWTAGRPRAGDTAATFLWLGVREGQLFGYRRDIAGRLLGEPTTRWLVIVEPHPFAPVALMPALTAGLDETGVAPATTVSDARNSAAIFRVDPAIAGRFASDGPLHLDSATGLDWLERGEQVRSELAAAEAVLDTTDAGATDRLLAALTGVVCAEPAGQPYPAGWLRFGTPSADGSCGS